MTSTLEHTHTHTHARTRTRTHTHTHTHTRTRTRTSAHTHTRTRTYLLLGHAIEFDELRFDLVGVVAAMQPPEHALCPEPLLLRSRE